MSTQLTTFLSKENKLLKQQNSQLKTLLSLNRQALRLSNLQKKNQTTFISLIKLLYEQNSKLHRKVSALTIELQTGMCQALISQQIAFASTEQQKYLTNQLKDKLVKMRKQLQVREKKITELTKQQSERKWGNCGGLFPDVRVVEHTDFNVLSKKFNDQIQELLGEVDALKQEVWKYKDQKEQLLKLNLILTRQINQYKIIIQHQHQSTGSGEMYSGDMSRDLSKFMAYQRKIIEDEDDEDSGQDGHGFGDGDNEEDDDEDVGGSTIGQGGLGLSLGSSFGGEEKSKISKLDLNISKVPKLQLTKAKQIQQLIVQKINNQDNKKKGIVKEQKYKKIETEVTQLRKKIGTIMLEKIQIERQNCFLKKFTKELEGRNAYLLGCVNRKEERGLGQSFSGRFVGLMSEELGRNGQRSSKIEDTQTLLEICRDVTMNPVLRKVVNGTLDLPYRKGIQSYDV